MTHVKRLVWPNLQRNRRRVVLTAVSVGVSVFLFCALAAIVLTVRSFMTLDGLNRIIGVSDRYSLGETPLPETYGATMEGIPGIRAVLLVRTGTATYREAKDRIGVWAADHETFDAVFGESPGLREVPDGANDEFRKDRIAALVGKAWTNLYGWKIGDAVTLKASFPAARRGAIELPVRVVGIIESGIHASYAIVRRDYVEEVLGDLGSVELAFASVPRVDDVEPTRRNIETALMNGTVPIKTLSAADALNQRLAGLNFQTLIAIISGVVLVAALSIAGNTAGMTMRERVREVAVLKAVGLTTRQILVLYMTESVTVSLVGGAAGAVLSYLIFKIGGMFLRVGPLSYFEVPVSTVAIGFAAALAIGVISSAWPCWRVARLRVATALASV